MSSETTRGVLVEREFANLLLSGLLDVRAFALCKVSID
jgi:hypothetical protein